MMRTNMMLPFQDSRDHTQRESVPTKFLFVLITFLFLCQVFSSVVVQLLYQLKLVCFEFIELHIPHLKLFHRQVIMLMFLCVLLKLHKLDPELQAVKKFEICINFLNTPVVVSGGMQDAKNMKKNGMQDAKNMKKNEETMILELEETSWIEKGSAVYSVILRYFLRIAQLVLSSIEESSAVDSEELLPEPDANSSRRWIPSTEEGGAVHSVISNYFLSAVQEILLPIEEGAVDSEELLPEPDANSSGPGRSFVESKWRCFEFLYLFPKKYEFDKDDIVQLWISQGFIPVEMNIEMKDTAIIYFNEFLEDSLIQFSSLNCSTNRPRYKLNHSFFDFLQEAPNDDYSRSGIEGGKPINMSENTKHASLLCNHNDRLDLESLYSFKRLHTLLLLNEHASCIERIPQKLFMHLNLLRALDCSYTKITELPSSVVHSKDLRYLNLSGTAIKMLPESLCSLAKLQTLLLRDCTELVGLPKAMRKLLNLEYLDFDLACLSIYMPPGFGSLVKLQVLPAFVISKDDRCHIDELKSMVHLRGSLCISRLENVSNSKEAQQAGLNEKKNLEKLELQWSESAHDGEEVLCNLQPHAGLKVLQVVGYNGATFPRWIADPIFSKLVDITFYNCRRVELLPPLGKLPSLKSIRVGEMHAVQTIDTRFCGRDMIKGISDVPRVVLHTIASPFSCSDKFTAFPMLENLKLNGMLNLEKWSGMQVGDFPMLQKLTLSRFSKLNALPELSVLKSLQQLDISFCPALQFFPKNGLPTSLQSLLIVRCPLLKERCRKSEGEEWGKISYIPDILIDYQQII